MISSAALAVVTSMMASFGGTAIGAGTEDVACIAGHVWWHGRGAGFARKLDIAKDAVDDALAAGSVAHSCQIVVAAQPAGDAVAVITLDDRTDRDAWNDSILAALAAINSAVGETATAQPPRLAPAAAQATIVAHGNLEAFWKHLPDIGAPSPPAAAKIALEAEPVCWVDHSREQLRFRRCLSR